MRNIFIIIISLILLNCGNSKISNFNSELEKIEQGYASDKSIAVLNAELEKVNSGWILRCETSSPKAKDEILATAKSILGKSNFEDSLTVLPHLELGTDTNCSS